MVRDSFLLPRGAGVTDTSARQDGPYFGAYYLGGLAVLAMIAGAILLMRRWKTSVPVVVGGFVLIGIGLGRVC